jgi:hypothetical protein
MSPASWNHSLADTGLLGPTMPSPHLAVQLVALHGTVSPDGHIVETEPPEF